MPTVALLKPDWVGEAMRKVDYKDAGPKPNTTGTTATLAANAAHLARLLVGSPFR